MGLNPGLSAIDHVDIQFARHLARVSDGQQGIKPISEEFRVPSATALLAIDPPFCLKCVIRKSERITFQDRSVAAQSHGEYVPRTSGGVAQIRRRH